jgi:hypothetical protein
MAEPPRRRRVDSNLCRLLSVFDALKGVCEIQILRSLYYTQGLFNHFAAPAVSAPLQLEEARESGGRAVKISASVRRKTVSRFCAIGRNSRPNYRSHKRPSSEQIAECFYRGVR